MPVHAVSGRSGTTAATAGHNIGHLWNPSGGQAISVTGFQFYNSVGTGSVARINRTTVRGTAGSTVTPDVDNSFDRRDVSPSVPLLDLGPNSVQPTITTQPLFMTHYGAFAGGSHIEEFPVPVVVPPGTGLVFCTDAATATGGDVTWIWEDGGGAPYSAFYVGQSPSTLSVSETVFAQIWNSDAINAIYVFYISFGNQTAQAIDYSVLVRRTSTAGTSTNITPGTQHNVNNTALSTAGVTIRHNFTLEPTLVGNPLARFPVASRDRSSFFKWTVGMDDENGIDWDDCIVVPPGSGLAIVSEAANQGTTKALSIGWIE